MPGEQPDRLISYPGFARLWAADTLTNFGSHILPLAIQFYMIDVLAADQFDIGLVRAAQWLPYLLFGLIAGALIDQVRRRPLLIASDLASGTLFVTLVVLGVSGHLSISLIAILIFMIGTVSVVQSGAHQSFVPDLVPLQLLTQANTRLTQTWTMAQTLGPLVGGALVRLFGAPIAIVLTGAAHFCSAILLLGVPESEAPTASRDRSPMLEQIRIGIRWVYGHPTLTPYALSLHAWFIGSSICGTVYIYYAVYLGLDGFSVGTTLASAGVAGIVGAALAERAASRFGLGPVVIWTNVLTGVGWLVIAAVAWLNNPTLWLCLGQALFGFGLGLNNPITMSYRNAITPSHLRGRMNTAIRSFNWGLLAIAAPVGGLLAEHAGNSLAIVVGALIMIVSGAALSFTPFKTAAMPAVDA